MLRFNEDFYWLDNEIPVDFFCPNLKNPWRKKVSFRQEDLWGLVRIEFNQPFPKFSFVFVLQLSRTPWGRKPIFIAFFSPPDTYDKIRVFLNAVLCFYLMRL